MSELDIKYTLDRTHVGHQMCVGQNVRQTQKSMLDINRVFDTKCLLDMKRLLDTECMLHIKRMLDKKWAFHNLCLAHFSLQ